MEAPVDANGNPTGGAPQPLQFDAASLPSGQGALQGISIGTNGTIVGNFASGQQIALASVPLSSFRGEDFLHQNADGTVSATALSGAASTTASGSVVGGALEFIEHGRPRPAHQNDSDPTGVQRRHQNHHHNERDAANSNQLG